MRSSLRGLCSQRRRIPAARGAGNRALIDVIGGYNPARENRVMARRGQAAQRRYLRLVARLQREGAIHEGDADGMRWWAHYALRQPDGMQQLVEANRRLTRRLRRGR